MHIVTYTLAAGTNTVPLMQGKRFVRAATATGVMVSVSYGNAAGQEMRLAVSQFGYEPYSPIYVDEGDYLTLSVAAATTLSIGYVE